MDPRLPGRSCCPPPAGLHAPMHAPPFCSQHLPPTTRRCIHLTSSGPGCGLVQQPLSQFGPAATHHAPRDATVHAAWTSPPTYCNAYGQKISTHKYSIDGPFRCSSGAYLPRSVRRSSPSSIVNANAEIWQEKRVFKTSQRPTLLFCMALLVTTFTKIASLGPAYRSNSVTLAQ